MLMEKQSLMNVNRDLMKKPSRKSMNIFSSMFHKILFISLDDRISCVWNIIRNSMRMEPLKEVVSPGHEANYDMIDGLVNNEKKQANAKDTVRTDYDVKPKKRRSVIKRLREKQIAIAVKSGKPIPKYLDQEIERRRR